MDKDEYESHCEVFEALKAYAKLTLDLDDAEITELMSVSEEELQAKIDKMQEEMNECASDHSSCKEEMKKCSEEPNKCFDGFYIECEEGDELCEEEIRICNEKPEDCLFHYSFDREDKEFIRDELNISSCEDLCGKGRRAQGGKITNRDDIAEDFDFAMFDEQFRGESDECQHFGIAVGDEDLLEDDQFLERFGMCDEWTEEDKERWAEEKTEKGEKEKEKKGMNCDKFKDSYKVNVAGENLYENCLAIRALCEEAKEYDEEMPEECMPPERMECESDDSDCEDKQRRGRNLRRLFLEDTEYTASEAPKCRPVDFDDERSERSRDEDRSCDGDSECEELKEKCEQYKDNKEEAPEECKK